MTALPTVVIDESPPWLSMTGLMEGLVVDVIDEDLQVRDAEMGLDGRMAADGVVPI